jgi:hypothetical protein
VDLSGLVVTPQQNLPATGTRQPELYNIYYNPGRERYPGYPRVPILDRRPREAPFRFCNRARLQPCQKRKRREAPSLLPQAVPGASRRALRWRDGA